MAKKQSTKKPAAKGKARKPASRAAQSATKIIRPGSTVTAFRPRNAAVTQTMETLMTQKKQQFDRMTQDAAASGKESMDAVIQSGNIVFKGMEDVFKTCIQMAQTSAEKNAQGFKSLLGCRTLSELTEANNRLAQQSFDDFMATTTRLSELTVKLASEAFEPINDQMNRSIRKVSDAVAA